jgi:PDZ domain
MFESFFCDFSIRRFIDCPFSLPPLGIRVGDYIVKINDTPAENLTLLEAQLEIHESGRHLKLFVKGFVKKLIAHRKLRYILLKFNVWF